MIATAAVSDCLRLHEQTQPAQRMIRMLVMRCRIGFKRHRSEPIEKLGLLGGELIRREDAGIAELAEFFQKVHHVG